ncbi:oxidoreductase [Microbacterium sp. SORGH_AS_0862]|uniref:oxidoreductase n=1 Tax=Microbacterium sp. SORGH_AS_0862 TaxID=3041789 RepID=UPI0027941C4B|nr:oxidoreductase [Microbacterium sp. SORGH_AS_0862]MDQ1204863.1 2-dehydropantoate 2-reductase [Microbacterium sp. SORGH_AS_0862]
MSSREDSNPQTVAVVGPGAIGTTVAAALHEAGRTPRLYGRTYRARLELRAADARIQVPGPVHTDPGASAAVADIVFLAVKATQLQAAAPWLRVLCGRGSVVCVLQNGIEQVELVAPLVPSGTEIAPAVVWSPAQRQSDGAVLLRGDARISLPRIPAALRVASTLRGTRCAVELEDDYVTTAWRKLLQNATAGLMALAGRRSGMFARPDVARLALAYLRECARVARAEGALVEDRILQDILAGFRSAPADMGTSILVDREAGRPLEWEVRNEVISRLARRHGLSTPISDVVVPLLAAASDGPG